MPQPDENTVAYARMIYRTRARTFGNFGHFVDDRVSSVYVIGPSPKGPVKVGMAKNLSSRLSTIRGHNWQPIELQNAYWFKGPPLAERVEAEAHRLLNEADRHIRGEWYDVNAGWASRLIRLAADNLGIEWHSERKMAQLILGEVERIDRVGADPARC